MHLNLLSLHESRVMHGQPNQPSSSSGGPAPAGGHSEQGQPGSHSEGSGGCWSEFAGEAAEDAIVAACDVSDSGEPPVDQARLTKQFAQGSKPAYCTMQILQTTLVILVTLNGLQQLNAFDSFDVRDLPPGPTKQIVHIPYLLTTASPQFHRFGDPPLCIGKPWRQSQREMQIWTLRVKALMPKVMFGRLVKIPRLSWWPIPSSMIMSLLLLKVRPRPLKRPLPQTSSNMSQLFSICKS